MKDGELHAVSRGTSGIVEQNTDLPDGWTLVAPPTVVSSQLFSACDGAEKVPALVLTGAGQGAAARLVEVQVVREESVTVDTPTGRRQAEVFSRVLDGERSRWWIDAERGLALRVETPDETIVLVELDGPIAGEASPEDEPTGTNP